jgi:hypothetical protein
MKYLKRFCESFTKEGIYEIDWHEIAPDSLVVIKGDTTDMNGFILDRRGNSTGQLCKFRLGNIMANLVHQVTYDQEFTIPGVPNTLEFDISIINNDNNNKFEMNVEITFGDLISAGFNIIAPNTIKPYLYTSYYSKTDPSNTVFAFDELSLQKLVKFFNKFDSMHIERKDLNFLDVNPNNYRPS